MEYRVIQQEQTSNGVTLYATQMDNGNEAWTGRPSMAETWTNRADAEAEAHARLDKGYYLRGWSVRVQEVK